MASVHLLGRVVPGEPKISLNDLPSFNWVAQELGFTFEFKITLCESAVDVECTLPQYKPEYLTEVHRRSFDLARTVVNLAAFCEGYGWTILFEHFVDDSGVQTPFIARDLDLAALCTTYTGSVDFGKILTIVGTDPTLMRHLNDLIQAITIPHESSTSCARAIEGLKHMIARPDSSDNAAWRQMQEALRADKAYLQFITNASREGRHGKHHRIEGDVTREVTVRAWKIMDRYFTYRKRGGTAPLPENEFPMLTG